MWAQVHRDLSRGALLHTTVMRVSMNLHVISGIEDARDVYHLQQKLCLEKSVPPLRMIDHDNAGSKVLIMTM
jgi:hypothetical protein